MTHTPEPDKVTEERDQREFNEAVNRKGKWVLEAVAGLGVLAAVVMSAVALSQSSQGGSASATAASAVKAAAVAPAATSQPAAIPVVDLKIIGAYKLASDGAKHDAFTKTEFAVKVGQPLKLRIDNTDDVDHSITAPTAGVNITAKPGTHTYTLVVHSAGKFQWYCMVPCDSDANGWAMQNPGYMSGYITAT
jgi:heme/copper-type cytochrome/quinol oxidase subunit 2